MVKTEMYFVIEARGSNLFFPIARSEIRKAGKFKEFKIFINNKFQGKENTSVRIIAMDVEK
jgi:hypothetical protein